MNNKAMWAVGRRELQKDRYALEHSKESYVQVEEYGPTCTVTKNWRSWMRWKFREAFKIIKGAAGTSGR